MDENLNNNDQSHGTDWSPEEEQRESMQQNAGNIRKFAMDDSGRIRPEDVHAGNNGVAVFARSSRIYIVLGWVCAALTAFIHPFFAIAGIIFGVSVNKQSIGRGNAIIISNIVLAAINIILSMFFIAVS
jgi:hypothetical protein